MECMCLDEVEKPRDYTRLHEINTEISCKSVQSCGYLNTYNGIILYYQEISVCMRRPDFDQVIFRCPHRRSQTGDSCKGHLRAGGKEASRQAGADGVMLLLQLCDRELGSCVPVVAGIIADTGMGQIRRFTEKPQHSQPLRKTPRMKFYRNRHEDCQKPEERSDIHHDRIVTSALE